MRVLKLSILTIGIIMILAFSVSATSHISDPSINNTTYPADIKVGDSLDSFATLNPRQIEYPKMTPNDYIEFILWYPDEYDQYFVDENGNSKQCKDAEILSLRREIRYYELQAPEGTYTYCVKDQGYLTEDFYVESIDFTPRVNRMYDINKADFPISEIKLGDPFEKLLLLNPIRVTLLEGPTSHVDELYLHAGMDYLFDDAGNIVSQTPVTNQEIIKYKLFVDGGEYLYTLRRPASNQGAAYKEFYITNIEFIKAT